MNETYELLPEAIAGCIVNRIEVRLIKISDSELTVRMTKQNSDNIFNSSGDDKSPLFVVINVYDYFAEQYNTIEVEQANVQLIVHKKYYDEIVIRFDDHNNMLKDALKRATDTYWRYITLKYQDYDNSYSGYMCNYPYEKDDEYPKDFVSQRRSWCKETDFNKVFKNTVKYAVKINTYLLYDKFLSMNTQEYITYYFENAGVILDKENYKKINTVYIGNSFCPNLFPDDIMLINLIEKAYKAGMYITIECSYMRQNDIERYENTFRSLLKWCKDKSVKIRIVVNDYGMINMLDDREYREFFIISAGVLINKYRKDPRMKYKNRLTKSDIYNIKNAMSNREFYSFMKEHGISECEYESNPVKYDMPFKMALVLPFYQTNTSENCTLYAAVVNGDRGEQKEMKNCFRLCEKKLFLYPNHLKMTGRYNSLFAFNDKCIEDAKYYTGNDLNNMNEVGIIVFDFLGN